MKNKKLGKILLCTTLALTTPFVMTACGKKSNNNDEPAEQTISQRLEEPMAVPYAINFNSQSTRTAEGKMGDADAVKDTLTSIIFGSYDAESPYWQGIRSSVDEMIGDEFIRLDETRKYVFTLDETVTAKNAYDAYVALYANSEEWQDMSESGVTGYENAEGIYYNFGDARDVLVCIEYDSAEYTESGKGEVTVYVFSFTGHEMEKAMNDSKTE